MTPENGSTGAAGMVSSTFTPSKTGSQNVTVTAVSPLTGEFSVTYPLPVYQTPVKPSPTYLQLILMYWYLIVPAVIAVLVAVFYLLRMRRRRQRTEIEAGFEAV